VVVVVGAAGVLVWALVNCGNDRDVAATIPAMARPLRAAATILFLILMGTLLLSDVLPVARVNCAQYTHARFRSCSEDFEIVLELSGV
jgi:hypothetical protein